MRATTTRLTTVLLLVALAALPAGAQQEPLADAGLEREVRQLNATLGRLVELLSRQLEGSNAAVLMQRVQLMTARIAPLEQELRTARGELGGFEREIDEMELAVASYEAQLEREVEEGQITEEQARLARDQQEALIRARKKKSEQRAWTARQRVIDLEQTLEARRAEIETWEGEIDRVLGLR